MENLGNLSGLLGPILSDPETMAKLKDVAAGLGLGDKIPSEDKINNTFDKAADPEMNNQEDPVSDNQEAPPSESQNEIPGDLIPPSMTRMLSRAIPMLAEKETEASALLFSLEPFLREERRVKLREAIHMMKLMRVMSAIIPEGKLPKLL